MIVLYFIKRPIMQPSDHPQERLRQLFVQQPCRTIDDLVRALDYSDISVRRFLKQVGYFSSFTHNSKWYTLHFIPVFDKYGLWFYEKIGFSKHGNLIKTIHHFINKSPQGLSAQQLSERLRTPCHAVLSQMSKRGALDRFQSPQNFVYLAIDEARKHQQLARLEALQRVAIAAQVAEPLTAQAAVHVLVEFIKHPQASVDELSRAVAKKQVLATPNAIARFFEEHHLKKTLK